MGILRLKALPQTPTSLALLSSPDLFHVSNSTLPGDSDERDQKGAIVLPFSFSKQLLTSALAGHSELGGDAHEAEADSEGEAVGLSRFPGG